jgi:AraC-like DNA-binding protein
MIIYHAPTQPRPESKSHLLDNYRFYQASQVTTAVGSAVHTFHFETLSKQHLRVDYPSSFYKLVYCFDGYAENFCGRTKIRSFQKGKALFYRTHPDTYSSRLKSDTRFQVVHLHLSQPMVDQLEVLFAQPFREVEIEIPIPPSSHELLNTSRMLDSCRPELADLFVEKIIFDQLYSFFDTWKGCQNLIAKTSQAERDKIREAQYLIDQANHYLTINQLAKAVGMNAFQLKKVFKAELNATVFEYQVGVLLSKAYKSLIESDHSVQEIAFACGYESVGSFSNAFKRKFGLRPSEVKKIALNKSHS